MSLHELHGVLQVAMGWKAIHLFRSSIRDVVHAGPCLCGQTVGLLGAGQVKVTAVFWHELHNLLLSAERRGRIDVHHLTAYDASCPAFAMCECCAPVRSSPLSELAGIIGGAFVAAVTAWLTGYLDLRLPPPARVQLALRNLFASPQVPKDRFRIVLCWLKHDRGKDGETVGCAFSTVDGIDLVRSARLVKAGGAADDWVPAMREGALTAMNAWAADLAVV
ncbi:MAG: hypothetical protein OXQ29_13095, partial [Rhodospirillaceae bacterium]|nr:hypothetical protein [Rhodospirillaceae bacterium]